MTTWADRDGNGEPLSIGDFLIARTVESEARASITHLDTCARREVPPSVCNCAEPLRVLRAMNARRLVLAIHAPGRFIPASSTDGVDYPSLTQCRGHDGDFVEYPCELLKIMANIYADHPDYVVDWAWET